MECNLGMRKHLKAFNYDFPIVDFSALYICLIIDLLGKPDANRKYQCKTQICSISYGVAVLTRTGHLWRENDVQILTTIIV